MAFITGSDETATAQFTLFPKIFANFTDLEKGNIIKIRGVVEKRLNEYQIVVNKIKRIEGQTNEETY